MKPPKRVQIPKIGSILLLPEQQISPFKLDELLSHIRTYYQEQLQANGILIYEMQKISLE